MSGILSAICTNYAVSAAIPATVKVLVVGGGAGAGAGSGGGGGAGGYQYDAAYAITNNTLYTVTVGGGGNGSPAFPASVLATDGGNSVFGTITALGGGHGTWEGGQTSGSGGCGGGSAAGATPGTGSQGGNGVAGNGGAPYNGGGGGGAGGNGGVSTGGIGIENSISGTPTYYAGGGAGGPDDYRGGAGASGGLGGGGSSAAASAGGNGTNGLGGGGAGGANNPHSNGGNGGSGVVIISYVGSAIATGGTITTSGGNTIHTFTSSGSFIVGTPPPTYATWNPSNKAASITLSNGDLTTSDSGDGWSTGLGTLAKSSGKWYWEVTCVANTGNHHYGVTKDTTYNAVSYIGQNTNSYGYAISNGNMYYNNSATPTGVSYGNGDVIGIALDLDGGTLDFYKNNVFVYQFTGLSGTFYPAFSTYQTNDSLTANFGATALTYTPPTGFNAGLYE